MAQFNGKFTLNLCNTQVFKIKNSVTIIKHIMVFLSVYSFTENFKYRNNSKYWDTQTSYRSCP